MVPEGVVLPERGAQLRAQHLPQLLGPVVGAVDEIPGGGIGVDPAEQFHRVAPRAAQPTGWPKRQPSLRGPPDRRANPPRNAVCEATDCRCQVTGITGEDLVAAHAAEDDGETLARSRADEVGRDRGRIGNGVVHVPDEAWKQVYDVRRERSLVVVHTEPR